jgi:hypothetical protein
MTSGKTAPRAYFIVADQLSGIDYVKLQVKEVEGSSLGGEDLYDSGVISMTYGGNTTVPSHDVEDDQFETWTWIIEGTEVGQGEWAANYKLDPLINGRTYSFDWTVKDLAGNLLEKTTYGAVGETVGYFEVNENKIDSTTQVLILNSKIIDVYFYATAHADLVQSVRVTLKDDSGTEIKSDLLDQTTAYSEASGWSWYKTPYHAFAQDGIYILEGLVEMPTKTVQMMSIISDLGDSTFSIANIIENNISIITGLVVAITGTIILGVGKRK